MFGGHGWDSSNYPYPTTITSRVQYQNGGLTPECPESERRIVLTRDVKPANILGDG